MCKNVYDFMLTLEPLSYDHVPSLKAMLEHDKVEGFKWVSEGYTDIGLFIRDVLFHYPANGTRGFYWAIRFGNAIVGFSGFRYIDDEGKYLTKTYITPTARGMGIADNVTRSLVVLADKLSFKLYSKVDDRNKRSKARLDRIASEGQVGCNVQGKSIYLLDKVTDDTANSYSPVVFALSERMFLDVKSSFMV